MSPDVSAGGDERTDTENFMNMLEQLNSAESAWGLFLQALKQLQDKLPAQTIQLSKQGTVKQELNRGLVSVYFKLRAHWTFCEMFDIVYHKFFNKGASPPIKAPPLFRGVYLSQDFTFLIISQPKWSDFHSVKSLWKLEMPSVKSFPCFHALRLY